MLRKEEAIRHLQEDLLESQTQHSACYNELVKIEEEFELLKADHSQLSKTNQGSNVEITALHDQIHQLELDLTITQEKHRTCQKEVASRDQVILRLQADLDTAQQNYSGSLDELKISEGEMKRMSGKLKQLQQEIRENNDSIDIKNNQIADYEKKIQQLQHDEEMALQEAKNHLRTIEQLRSDFQIHKNSSGVEISRIQEGYEATRDELEATHNELAEYKRANMELMANIAELNDDLTRYKNLQDESVNDIYRQNELLKDQEVTLSETRQQLSITQTELEAANET